MPDSASVTLGPKLGQVNYADIGANFPNSLRALLRAVDALVQASVLSVTLAAPPGSPANGDAYVVAASPTGAWAGQANSIAVWSTQIATVDTNTKVPAWEFHVPLAGWLVFNVADGKFYLYSGTAWGVKGGLTPNVSVKTSGTGTFTIPAGVTALKVTVVGGGGGGGSNPANSGAAGGGGGATSYKWLSGLTPGNTLNYTVDPGGAAGTAAGAGGNGGTSSVSSGTQTITTITAPGGQGGGPGNNSGGPGAVAGTGADIALSGGGGGYGFGATGQPGGYGGGTAFAGPGANQSSGGPGFAGGINTGQGGGGADAAGTFNGGAGGSGIVIFEWIS